MLMLFTPDEVNIEEIITEVHKISGCAHLHHIHVWHLNEEELHLEAHLDCSDDMTLSQFNILLHKIEDVLYEKFSINHVNIQPEFKKEDPKDFIVQD
jgi:cobalt-zinc-cadmium efflux system protein